MEYGTLALSRQCQWVPCH